VRRNDLRAVAASLVGVVIDGKSVEAADGCHGVVREGFMRRSNAKMADELLGKLRGVFG
jgi:hypothetical protein